MSGQPLSKTMGIFWVAVVLALCVGIGRACYRTLYPPPPLQKLGQTLR